MTLEDRLGAAPTIALARRALADRAEAVWIVGGAVRDAALEREVSDLDLAVAGDARAAATAIAAAGDGHAFELSAEFGTWRAVARDGSWQIDATALRAETIEEDLAGRDFTIGAVAVPLKGGPPIDPFGGLDDLKGKVLRVVGKSSFSDDPLRLLRAARLAAELGLELDPDTRALARSEAAGAAQAAGERQLAELRGILAGAEPLRGIELLEELGVAAVVLPELDALHGILQGPNHHLDVHAHTLAVLERLLEVERDLERFVGERAEETRELLTQPLADEMTRGTALRFGALLHDIGKSATREERDGYVTFIGHDQEGAAMVGAFCRRLRASRTLSTHLRGLTLHHLRLGFLVHEMPLAPRRIHEYLRTTGPVAADVTVLTIADRLSARGSGPLATEDAIEAHVELAQQVLAAALDWRRDGPPPPLLRGDELVDLGVPAGPELGELLAELEAAQYAGEVTTRPEALDLIRRIRG